MVINSVNLLRPFKERSIYLCVGVRFPGAVAVLSQGCRSISLAWYPLSDIPCRISLAEYSYKYHIIRYLNGLALYYMVYTISCTARYCIPCRQYDSEYDIVLFTATLYTSP